MVFPCAVREGLPYGSDRLGGLSVCSGLAGLVIQKTLVLLLRLVRGWPYKVDWLAGLFARFGGFLESSDVEGGFARFVCVGGFWVMDFSIGSLTIWF